MSNELKELVLAPAELTTAAPTFVPTAEQQAQVEAAAKAATAPATQEAYRGAWANWGAWCQANAVQPLAATPEAVAAYLTDRAPHYNARTLKRHLSAINGRYRLASLPSPVTPAVLVVLRGLTRLQAKPVKRKAPVTEKEMRKLLATVTGHPLRQARDKLLLLLGYAGAFRASNLVALEIRDLRWREGGVDLRLRKSKTDQAAVGRWVAITEAPDPVLCPVRALRLWLELSRLQEGPVLRGFAPDRKGLRKTPLTKQVVCDVVQELAGKAGLEGRAFGSHSLRAGHVTQAFRNGATITEIMGVTGHTSERQVLEYRREEDPRIGSSANKLWATKKEGEKP